MKDWKTSMVGLGVIFAGAAFLAGRIGLNEFLGAFAMLTGVGFGVAKDAAK